VAGKMWAKWAKMRAKSGTVSIFEIYNLIRLAKSDRENQFG
jgi:hypothetical protein